MVTAAYQQALCRDVESQASKDFWATQFCQNGFTTQYPANHVLAITSEGQARGVAFSTCNGIAPADPYQYAYSSGKAWCVTLPVWGSWSNWSPYDGNCPTMTAARTRSCFNPSSCNPSCAGSTVESTTTCCARAYKGASTCAMCSSCPSGSFIASPCTSTTNTVCQACATCSPPSTYQASACTSNANTVCAVCSSCSSGKYLSKACSLMSNSVCSVCSSCASGTYKIGGCDSSGDTTCKACTSCINGAEYVLGSCAGTQNTVCASCTPCTAGYTYRIGGCDGKIDTVCTSCTACSSTQYAQNACTVYSNTVCKTCSACAVGSFKIGGCVGTMDTACALCTAPCAIGFYEIQPCAPVTNRMCSLCPACPAGTYKSGGCDGILASVCTALTKCTSLQFETKAPTLTSDRKCQAYVVCRAKEQYEIIAGTPTSDRKCAPCSQCDSGMYASTPCSLTSDAKCSPCTTCPMDYHNIGGCFGSVDSNCMQCEACPPDYFLVGGCTTLTGTPICNFCPTCDPNGAYTIQSCTPTAYALCSPCITNCTRGLNISSPCTPYEDAICADITPPVITLNGFSSLTLEQGKDSYLDPGAVAKDTYDGDLTDNITTSNDFDPSVYFEARSLMFGKSGSFSITYSVFDSAGNGANVSRNILVHDTLPPSLTLFGNLSMVLQGGQDQYTEPGYYAFDFGDGGNITNKVLSNVSALSTDIVGVQVIGYSVSDGSGHLVTANRVVTVVDSLPPSLILFGSSDIVLEASPSDFFLDPGFECSDLVDGDLLLNVVVTPPYLSLSTPGTYVINYTVHDSSNNSALQARLVHLVDTTPPVLSLKGPVLVEINVGASYAEAGYSAVDSIDGTLPASRILTNSSSVTMLGAFDSSYYGATFYIIYTAMDLQLNNASLWRTVTVVDTIGPAISVFGGALVEFEFTGPSFNYTPPIVTATDARDGALSADHICSCSIMRTSVEPCDYASVCSTISGVFPSNSTFDPSKPLPPLNTTHSGQYVVVYVAKDSLGNHNSSSQTIVVKKNPDASTSEKSSSAGMSLTVLIVIVANVIFWTIAVVVLLLVLRKRDARPKKNEAISSSKNPIMVALNANGNDPFLIANPLYKKEAQPHILSNGKELQAETLFSETELDVAGPLNLNTPVYHHREDARDLTNFRSYCDDELDTNTQQLYSSFEVPLAFQKQNNNPNRGGPGVSYQALGSHLVYVANSSNSPQRPVYQMPGRPSIAGDQPPIYGQYGASVPNYEEPVRRYASPQDTVYEIPMEKSNPGAPLYSAVPSNSSNYGDPTSGGYYTPMPKNSKKPKQAESVGLYQVPPSQQGHEELVYNIPMIGNTGSSANHVSHNNVVYQVPSSQSSTLYQVPLSQQGGGEIMYQIPTSQDKANQNPVYQTLVECEDQSSSDGPMYKVLLSPSSKPSSQQPLYQVPLSQQSAEPSQPFLITNCRTPTNPSKALPRAHMSRNSTIESIASRNDDGYFEFDSEDGPPRPPPGSSLGLRKDSSISSYLQVEDSDFQTKKERKQHLAMVNSSYSSDFFGFEGEEDSF